MYSLTMAEIVVAPQIELSTRIELADARPAQGLSAKAYNLGITARRSQLAVAQQ